MRPRNQLYVSKFSIHIALLKVQLAETLQLLVSFEWYVVECGRSPKIFSTIYFSNEYKTSCHESLDFKHGKVMFL